MRLNKHIVSGLALVAVGTWIALAPFVAGTWAWEWDLGRFLLTVVPGAAAVVGGLIMLGGRRSARIGGGLALAGGLWLMAGPLLHALVAGPELGTTPEGAAVRMLEMIPFFFAAGALVSFISAYAAGFLSPLEFADEAWAEPASTRRARVPMPTERPRRQRGTEEPVQPRTQPKDGARRDR
jgi:hypothetical protein